MIFHYGKRKSHVPRQLDIGSAKESGYVQCSCVKFRNILLFKGKLPLAPRPISKFEDHILSVVRHRNSSKTYLEVRDYRKMIQVVMFSLEIYKILL
jgi:hypothetical protein